MKHIAVATERELAAAVSDEHNAERQVKSLETATNGVGLERNKLSELEREATALRTTYEKALAARENVPRDVVHSALATLVGPPVAGIAPVSPRLLPDIACRGRFRREPLGSACPVDEYRARTSRVGPKGEGGKSLSARVEIPKGKSRSASRLQCDRSVRRISRLARRGRPSGRRRARVTRHTPKRALALSLRTEGPGNLGRSARGRRGDAASLGTGDANRDCRSVAECRRFDVGRLAGRASRSRRRTSSH